MLLLQVRSEEPFLETNLLQNKSTEDLDLDLDPYLVSRSRSRLFHHQAHEYVCRSRSGRPILPVVEDAINF